jgi:nitrate/TMAO reductase-like tetraheme cytochrome c subunit
VSLQLFFPIATQLYAATGAPQEGITGVELAKILGLGLGVLTLVLILFVFFYHRKSPLSQTAKWLHLLSLCVIPVFLLFLGNFVAYEEAKELEFCASCHPVMDPYVNDLKDPKSTTLAGIHNQRRLIQEAQCYSCHVGYGINGTGKAKMNGLIHLYKFYTGTDSHPIKLYETYSNSNCLRCHAEMKKFKESPTHDATGLEVVISAMSCMDCHAPAHPEQVASKQMEGGGK